MSKFIGSDFAGFDKSPRIMFTWWRCKEIPVTGITGVLVVSESWYRARAAARCELQTEEMEFSDAKRETALAVGTRVVFANEKGSTQVFETTGATDCGRASRFENLRKREYVEPKGRRPKRSVARGVQTNGQSTNHAQRRNASPEQDPRTQVRKKVRGAARARKN